MEHMLRVALVGAPCTADDDAAPSARELRVRRIGKLDTPLARHKFLQRTKARPSSRLPFCPAPVRHAPARPTMLTRSTAPSSQGMLTIDAFVERESAHVSATTAPAASTAAGDSWRSARHVVYAGSVPCAVLEASRVAEAAAVSANDYELVLCRVAVGRAWPICPSLLREKSALELARMRPPQGAHSRRPGPRTARLCSGRPRPPAGYDSFVLEDEERTDSETGLRYWMPSAQRLAARPGPPLPLASRVLPCYRVSFAYGELAVELAAVSPPPATSGHARAEEGQQETQRADGTCRFHRGQPCTYFCAHCQVALCCECKVSGHHSHGSIPSRPRPPLARMRALGDLSAAVPRWCTRIPRAACQLAPPRPTQAPLRITRCNN